MKQIYFDHNATSPINDKVWLAISDICKIPLNPSSLHKNGRIARKFLEKSREIIKARLNLNNSHELIFTSGCTEANNIVLKNFPEHKKICSCIEHPAVVNVIGEGVIPVDTQGIVDLKFLKNYLDKNKDKKILLSIMYANNEIGTIQPIQDIVNLIQQYDVTFHCDITQVIGRVDVNLEGIDLITFSSHKFGGPVGAGALIYNKNLILAPIFFGGGQEFRLRSGTQNLFAIYGMATAFKSLDKIKEEFSQTITLRKFLEKSLKDISNDIIVFGDGAKRLPNTSSIYMPNVNSETQLIYFDLNGISVSAGSACSSGKIELPRVQLSMSYPDYIAKNSIRVSLGPCNNMEEIERFCCLWKDLYKQNN